MNKGKKFCSLILITVFVIQMTLYSVVSAANVYIQPPPKNLKVNSVEYDRQIGEHLAELQWDHPDPVPPETRDSDINENGPIVEEGFYAYTSVDNSAFNLYPSNIAWSQNSIKINRNGTQLFESGTIYYARMTAYHKHSKDGVQVIHESVVPSNTVIFMTDLSLQVKALGPDALEIKWDDVRYNGRRIDYDIYISESKDFTQAFSLSVRQENISNQGPVIPIPAERKLSFVARGSEYGIRPGTIYYVKIKPIINDSRVVYNPQSVTVVGYTQIIATMTRISDEWWKIDWNPVTNASLQSGEKIIYKVKRGDMSQWNSPVLVTLGETTETKYFVSTAGGQYFFLIVAEVKDQFGNPIPDGIQSSRLIPVEGEVPAKPPVPELKSEIRKPIDDPNGEIIYKDNIPPWLTSTQATVAWSVPRHANGAVDTGVVYDIWLLTDPDDITNPNAQKLLTSFTVPSTNYIKIGDDIVAYSHTFTNLTPNYTYYFKIVAKKFYTVDEEGILVPKYFESDPAVKVIITPPGGPIDQPVAPAKPPFKVRLTPDGKQDVNQTNAWFQWKNKWREVWDPETYRWIYVEDDFDITNRVFRDIQYDSGVTFRIGYTPYQDGMDFNNIKNLPTQITGLPNNAQSVLQEYNLQGLTSNTTYVVWLRAYRQTGDLLSEPSDPIIVVTSPDSDDIVVKPAVPRFTYSSAGDTYVDLQWNYIIGYTYYIKYSTSGDINSAKDMVTVTPTDILRTAVYRINGLKENTVYYFWIQADSTGRKIEDGLSLWSDSHIVKTLPFIPPDIPRGFGVKNTPDAITKNSVAFEWTQVDKLEYILELSANIDFKNPKEYKAGISSEYNATGLRSNFRYYARLYAYDPVKKLRSAPTQSITVRTLRSDDDYDSDEDIEDVVTGPFVDSSYSDGVWILSITGVNAHRFIEKVLNDKVLDYKFDLASAPADVKKRVVIISNKVFRALSQVREYIILEMGYSRYVIRPYVLDTEQTVRLLNKVNDFNFEFTITDEGYAGYKTEGGLAYKSKACNVSVSALSGTENVPIKHFNKPLKVSFTYTEENLSDDKKAGCYFYNKDAQLWARQKTVFDYDVPVSRGSASADLGKPGKAVLMAAGDNSYRFSDLYNNRYKDAIVALDSRYNLKSVKDSKFRAYTYITREEAVKLIMDILGVDYGDDYAVAAAKAGFIKANVITRMDENCPRKEVMYMIDRLYELITYSKAEERIFTPEDDRYMERGEVMVELYNMLKGIGEL